MIRKRALGLGLLLSVALGGAGTGFAAPAANVTAKRLVKAESEPGQWMTYGGTYSEQRFSLLKSVNASNVAKLGLQWYADYETNQNKQARRCSSMACSMSPPRATSSTPSMARREGSSGSTTR